MTGRVARHIVFPGGAFRPVRGANHPGRMMSPDPGTVTVARMTDSRNPEPAFRVNSRPLIVGGVLMGLGGVLGLAGVVISGSCLAAAVRDWANRQEVPPTALARHHWERAKASASAGASAWRNGTQEHTTLP